MGSRGRNRKLITTHRKYEMTDPEGFWVTIKVKQLYCCVLLTWIWIKMIKYGNVNTSFKRDTPPGVRGDQIQRFKGWFCILLTCYLSSTCHKIMLLSFKMIHVPIITSGLLYASHDAPKQMERKKHWCLTGDGAVIQQQRNQSVTSECFIEHLRLYKGTDSPAWNSPKHQAQIFITSFIVHVGSRWCGCRAHWTTLALGGLGCLAVPRLFAHHLLTHHRSRVTHADSTRFWAPDLIVGEGCAVFWAGIFVRENISQMSDAAHSLSEQIIMGFSVTTRFHPQVPPRMWTRRMHRWTPGGAQAPLPHYTPKLWSTMSINTGWTRSKGILKPSFLTKHFIISCIVFYHSALQYIYI